VITDNDTGADAYMAFGWYGGSTDTSVNIDCSVVDLEST
jgi:hypothetical protein